MARFSASFVTHRGHVREHNEDNGLIDQVLTPQGLYHVWAVADGMGGLARGEVASETALATLAAELRAQLPVADPAKALGDAIGRANSNVYSAGKGAMGTTITAAIVHDASGRTWIGHIGDSRAYVTSSRGITQITDDHSKVGEAMRAGFLTEEEAFTTTGRNVLTRALGSDPEVAVDISGPHTLAPDEHLLLCSDGVHGMLRDRDIFAVLRPDQEGGPARVLDASLQAGGKDNITVLLGGLAEVAPVIVAGVPAHRSARKPAAANRPMLMPVIAAGAAGVFVVAIIGTVFVLGGSGDGAASPATSSAAAKDATKISSLEGTLEAGGDIDIDELVALYTRSAETATSTAASTNRPQASSTPVPAPPKSATADLPPTDAPTSTLTHTHTPTATHTPTTTPTHTPTPTMTPTPTLTPTPTNTPGLGVTATPTTPPPVVDPDDLPAGFR